MHGEKNHLLNENQMWKYGEDLLKQKKKMELYFDPNFSKWRKNLQKREENENIEANRSVRLNLQNFRWSWSRKEENKINMQ